ncbi:MAG: hypothetical protein HDR13_04050 [Lachnospiraceae bacterium]|nr:hypothetical protein [Lachnospiraceae bacterium]
MINLLLPGVMEKLLNRAMIDKALSEIEVDNLYMIVNDKDDLKYYDDLGTCYLREDVARGIFTDEQLELWEFIPLEDEVFEYMNPYVVEIINQQRRFEQRYDFQVSSAWESHYRIFMRNLLFWNSMLERKQITHVFFTRIPHEGYGSIIYHLCKMKNIPVMMAFASLIPNRDYPLTDYMTSDKAIREEYERLQEVYRDKSAEDIELEGNTKEEFAKWTSLDPDKMKPAYMKGNKLRQTFRARYGETNLIRVWRGILGKEYEKYGMGIGFLGASLARIPKLLSTVPATYKQWIYARPYWKETKEVNDFYEKVSELPKPGEKYIYFALHYQPEATSNPLGGGAYTDQIFPLQILCRSIPKDMHVYVKAHPAQLAFFGGISYYQDMLRMPQVRLMKMECSTYELIKNAFAVASLTGTACWESQFYGVSAILFGYSYKNASPLAYHVRTVKECRQAIQDIQEHKKTTTLKDLKLYTMAAHNLSYHVDERDRVFPELIVKLVKDSGE